MSSIFAIRDDNNTVFKELDLKLIDVMNNIPENTLDEVLDDVFDFHLKNTSMKSWWKTLETEFISLTDRDAPIPDISLWVRASLVLSPKAYRYLGDILQPSGELLPVTVNNETYYIFNCFVIGEADEDNSIPEYEGDMTRGLTHLEFKNSASENLIFKTPLESCLTLFCNEKLKEIIESFELTGISFDEKLIQYFD